LADRVYPCSKEKCDIQTVALILPTKQLTLCHGTELTIKCMKFELTHVWYLNMLQFVQTSHVNTIIVDYNGMYQ